MENIGGVIGAIIVIIAVVVIALFVFRYLKMSRDPEYAAKVNKKSADRKLARQKRKLERAEQQVIKAKYNDAIAPAKAALNKAKQDHNGRVKKAEDELRHAERAHTKALHEQERVIVDIQKKQAAYLAGVGPIKLYANHLEIRDTSITLDGTFSAEIIRGAELIGRTRGKFRFAEAFGDTKPNAPGSLIGGIGTPETLWEVVARTDYCYLFVDGRAEEYGSKPVMLCVPLDDRNLDDGDVFMKHLNEAAKTAEARSAEMQRELASAKAELERLQADTGKIENARQALEAAKADNLEMLQAQKAFDEAEKEARETYNYRP